MQDDGGLPLEAEYDEALKVVTASRVLTVEEYADASLRATAERDARAAVDALMAQRGLDYNDTPRPSGSEWNHCRVVCRKGITSSSGRGSDIPCDEILTGGLHAALVAGRGIAADLRISLESRCWMTQRSFSPSLNEN
jgi:hypothetical protein